MICAKSMNFAQERIYTIFSVLLLVNLLLAAAPKLMALVR